MSTKKIEKISLPIVITAEPYYLPEQSDPFNHKFTWSYEISITNESDQILQLLNRFWRITDMTGKVEKVQGPGVIGLQPLIKPNKNFVYSSFCQLLTPQGTMEGHYEMQNLKEELFTIKIPKFVLSAPSTISQLFSSKLH